MSAKSAFARRAFASLEPCAAKVIGACRLASPTSCRKEVSRCRKHLPYSLRRDVKSCKRDRRGTRCIDARREATGLGVHKSMRYQAAGRSLSSSSCSVRVGVGCLAMAPPSRSATLRSLATAGCKKTYAAARSFAQLGALVDAAESKLSSGWGFSWFGSSGDVLGQIRSIYYGSSWSADYLKEKSLARNASFNYFARGYLLPEPPFANPRPVLNCGVFDALAKSQDVVDTGAGRHHVDFGHLIIGLEARYYDNVDPVWAPPGSKFSGLEASTWVGDLAGGAALLAHDRSKAPKASISARKYFVGTNFGGSINLEGDVASFVVAADSSKTKPAEPKLVGSIADAIKAYLKPGVAPHNVRSKKFLELYGGTVKGTVLANRGTVVAALKPRIEDFACYYLANRLALRKVPPAKILADVVGAAPYISNASQEMADAFVSALEDNVKAPHRRLQATRFPKPSGTSTSPSRCVTVAKAALAVQTGAENIKKKADGTLKEWAEELEKYKGQFGL